VLGFFTASIFIGDENIRRKIKRAIGKRKKRKNRI